MDQRRARRYRAISGRENASQLILNYRDVCAISKLGTMRHVIKEARHDPPLSAAAAAEQCHDADISSLERVQRSTFNPRTCIHCLRFYS